MLPCKKLKSIASVRFRFLWVYLIHLRLAWDRFRRKWVIRRNCGIHAWWGEEKRNNTKITERIPASRGDLFERSTEMVFISILGWVWFPDGQARGFAFFPLLLFYHYCLFASTSNLGSLIPLFIYSDFFRPLRYVTAWLRGYWYGRRSVSLFFVSLCSTVFFRLPDMSEIDLWCKIPRSSYVFR